MAARLMADSYRGMECFFYRKEEKGMNCFKRITYVGLFIYDFHALNSFINYWKLTSEIYLNRKK